MTVQESMTTPPACCVPEEGAQDAARLKRQHDRGCLPVVEKTETSRLLGVVTDRPLALRGLAAGKGPQAPIRDIMSREPSGGTPDDDAETVGRIMTERRVRRVPVIDQAGCCVGMIPQGNLARADGGV